MWIHRIDLSYPDAEVEVSIQLYGGSLGKGGSFRLSHPHHMQGWEPIEHGGAQRTNEGGQSFRDIKTKESKLVSELTM